MLWRHGGGSRSSEIRSTESLNFWRGVFGQHVNTGGGRSPGVAAGQHGKEDGIDGATGVPERGGK
jgi:hypothetical protein